MVIEVIVISIITTLVMNSLLRLFRGDSTSDSSDEVANNNVPTNTAGNINIGCPANMLGLWYPTEQGRGSREKIELTKYGIMRVSAKWEKGNAYHPNEYHFQIKNGRLMVEEGVYKGTYPIKRYEEDGNTYLEIYQAITLAGKYILKNPDTGEIVEQD